MLCLCGFRRSTASCWARRVWWRTSARRPRSCWRLAAGCLGRRPCNISCKSWVRPSSGGGDGAWRHSCLRHGFGYVRLQRVVMGHNVTVVCGRVLITSVLRWWWWGITSHFFLKKLSDYSFFLLSNIELWMWQSRCQGESLIWIVIASWTWQRITL